MKIIKVVYDENTKYAIDIVNSLDCKFILETYDKGHHKEKKRAIPIMTRWGTKQVPLLVFEDENLEEYSAIWAEGDEELTVDLIKKYLNE